MCTCINIIANNTYFGRNLDLEYSFNEMIIITPRNYEIKFKKEKTLKTHYALLGIGTIIDNYPLYADVINEEGLAFAGLNFPDNCTYLSFNKDKINIAPYELPLYILGQCKNVKEVLSLISKINIINLPFSSDVVLTPLHFMISDKKESIVIESRDNNIYIHHNEFNVLTNNPSFEYHQNNVINYLSLHNSDPINNLLPSLKPYSNGLGALGLPGDFSSSSRFIKALFVKNNLVLNNDDNFNINQFFKCLESVSMIKGTVLTKLGYEYTRYTSCYNLNKKVLYYKTYDNSQLREISLFDFNLDDSQLINKTI